MPVQTTIVQYMVKAFAGMMGDNSDVRDVVSKVSQEASAEVPFGVGVALGSSNDDGALLPSGSGAKIVGIVAHSHAYDNGPNGNLGTTGVKPKAILNVLKKGRIWVTTEEAVVPGDPIFIRHTSGGGGTQLGAFRKSADTATALDCSAQGKFITTAAGGALALVEVDFTNKQ